MGLKSSLGIQPPEIPITPLTSGRWSGICAGTTTAEQEGTGMGLGPLEFSSSPGGQERLCQFSGTYSKGASLPCPILSKFGQVLKEMVKGSPLRGLILMSLPQTRQVVATFGFNDLFQPKMGSEG